MECNKCYNMEYGHTRGQTRCTPSTRPTTKRNVYNKILPFSFPLFSVKITINKIVNSVQWIMVKLHIESFVHLI